MIEIALAVRHPNGKMDETCPVLACDVYRKQIVKDGIFLWAQTSEPGEPARFTSPISVHRGRCDNIAERAQEAKHPDAFPGWEDADDFLGQLEETDAVAKVVPGWRRHPAGTPLADPDGGLHPARSGA